MVNLKSRIEDLKKATGSLTVKELCEKANAELSKVNEMRISKDANQELTTNVLEGLIKDLKNESDEQASKFVGREERFLGVNNLGVKRAISKIKESDISSHPALSYAIAQFEKLSSSPEYLIAENFFGRLSSFNWHPIVKESLAEIKENATKFKEDIIIHKSVYELKNSRSAYILSGIRESLDDYLLNRTKTAKSKLVEKLSKFTFDPLVRNLANAIRESVDNSLEVKTSKAGTEVERIYTPVIINENSEIFAIGTDIYEKEGSNLTKLTNQDISKLDPEFVKTVNFIASPNVKVSEGLITVYARNKKIEITNESIAVNGKTVTRDDFAKIYMNSGVFRRDELSTMGAITSIAENFNSIVELEFAKRFRTPLVGNRRIDVIKVDENIYLTKEDPQMGKLDFFKNLNATQTRAIVLEFMNYDIYESFGSMIQEDEAKLRSIENTKKTYIQTINQLEEKLQELKSIDDSYVIESKEYKSIVKVLEDEITGLKDEYSGFIAKAHEITTSPIAEADAPADEAEHTEQVTSEFTVDQRVHCKKSGQDGTVIAVNDVTGKVSLLLDDGTQCECSPGECEHIESTVTGIPEGEIEISVDGKKIEIETEEEDEEESDEESDKEAKSKDSEEEEDDSAKLEYDKAEDGSDTEDEQMESDDEEEEEVEVEVDETVSTVSAVAEKLSKMNQTNEDHAKSEEPAESTAEFTPDDRVETKDERYGTVTGVDDPTGDITVLFDDGETGVCKPEDLVIVDEKGVDETVSESAEAGDEVELEDGTKAQVTGTDDATGDIMVLDDKGQTHTVSMDSVKIISDKSAAVEEKDDVEGQQSDGESVDIKE